MDFKKLGETAAKSETITRPVVQDRVLQYDTDFACYEVSDLDETTAQSFKRLLDHIEMKRVIAGAEFVNAHITLGTKSGREDMASLKPYQDNRDPDAPIKVRVRELRHMLANSGSTTIMAPVFNLHYEADDMMVKYQHERIEKHGVKSSVIMSGDKDLWMGQGYHCDPKTGRLYLIDGFGHTEYREVGNVKPKLVGEGYSWFWHQMILGDTADNIPGLEKISNFMLDKYLPLKSGKARKNGAVSCGEAKAYTVLKGVTTDQEAAQRTYELYWEYYGAMASERMIEQAYLLWMQRTDDPWDILKYLHETCGLKINPSKRQLEIVEEFRSICQTS